MQRSHTKKKHAPREVVIEELARVSGGGCAGSCGCSCCRMSFTDQQQAQTIQVQ